jgi:hypothetical protein
MATTVEGLFNLPTAAQAGQQYLEGMMSSPAQLNQLSLLQQAVATGRNAGAMMGYGAGRLLGGKAPDEIRIEGVNQAMAEATQMGGTDAEMYANLAKGLAARGLTQDAMAATEKARSAKRDEQAMTLAASQEERAVKGDIRADKEAELRLLEEQRRVIAAQQAKAEYDQRMKMYPLEIQEKDLAIRKREQDLNGAMGEATMAQEALTKGINPKTGQPLTAEDERALRARLAQATLAINAEADKLAREKAEHELKMKSYEASIASSKASAKAAESRGGGAFTKQAFIQVPSEFPGSPPTKVYVGDKNPKTGEVLGKDGNIYQNENAAAQAQRLVGAPASALPAAPAAAPAAAAPAAKPTKKPDPKSFFRSSEPGAYTDPMGN